MLSPFEISEIAERYAEGAELTTQAEKDAQALLLHLDSMGAAMHEPAAATLVCHALTCLTPPELCPVVQSHPFEVKLVDLLIQATPEHRLHLATGYPLLASLVEVATGSLQGLSNVYRLAVGG